MDFPDAKNLVRNVNERASRHMDAGVADRMLERCGSARIVSMAALAIVAAAAAVLIQGDGDPISAPWPALCPKIKCWTGRLPSQPSTAEANLRERIFVVHVSAFNLLNQGGFETSHPDVGTDSAYG